MSLNRMGQAVFFTKNGKMIASAPPMTRPGQLQPLPPPLPPGELYNGSARLVDSAIPWDLEAAAREAVEEAREAVEEALDSAREPAREVARHAARDAAAEPSRVATHESTPDEAQPGPDRVAAA